MEKKDFIKSLKGYLPDIKKAKDQKKTEADTIFLLRKILAEAFGYDALDEISAEDNVGGKHVDLAIKINNKKIFFIEVKSAGTELKKQDVYQVAHYASEEGVKFALLTNISQYQFYQIEWNKDKNKIEHIPIFRHDILAEDIKKVGENLWLLTKKAFKHEELERFCKTLETLSDENLLKALVSEDVTNSIRKILKKMSGELVPRELVHRKICEKFPEETVNIIQGSTSQKPHMIHGRQERCSTSAEWNEKSSWTLNTAKELFSLIETDKKSIKYTQSYISIVINGKQSYCLDKRKQPNSILWFNIKDDEKADTVKMIFEKNNIDYNYNKYKDFVINNVDQNMIISKKAMFQEIIKIRHKEIFSEE